MSSHKTKVWSSHKTKTKNCLLKQMDLNVIFSMCILFSWGKLCHRMPNPMFVLAGRVNTLCLMHEDAECGLLQILHQNKKCVCCSTSCPPFFRMEINKRGAKVYCSGALQEHYSGLKEVVHYTCSVSVFNYNSALQFKSSI